MGRRKALMKVEPEGLMKALMEVRGGLLSAKAAAARLGISRKTYYEWEKRAMEGMMSALQPRPTGRPAAPSDPQMQQLRVENQDLRRQVQVLEQSLVIRRMLAEADSRSKKK